VIRLEHVTFAYRDQPVVRDVSFSVAPGETKVILGSSGSGKSTILKLILGLVWPQSGRVIIDGVDLTTARDSQLRAVRKKIGMVFQGGALFDSMTVGENIAYYLLEYTDKSLDEIEQIARGLLRFLNLPEDLLNVLPDELSGGMQRRVAIGRAIAAENPKIMLYDEPTTGLDPISIRTITELITKLQRESGVSSIVVTHQITDAFDISDKFLVVHRGKVLFDGDDQGLLQCPDGYVQDFLRPYLDAVRSLPLRERSQ
jgi:phospholipid/cholesterol/gamma-HCH transport system ATP-binding protein